MCKPGWMISSLFSCLCNQNLGNRIPDLFSCLSGVEVGLDIIVFAASVFIFVIQSVSQSVSHISVHHHPPSTIQHPQPSELQPPSTNHNHQSNPHQPPPTTQKWR
ncbi:hypothetical protein BO70DRAFT_85120 [Aspergillus heteromorphus CBS 117.55]|uniref:Uncharacterized protein n=1 Tax=Aspergillus heteromorphus CBS 117.55 TaxID=1448321 RepID=A0A317X0P9_9EURO|nr:uncharacterized protein BO70DRAFT_85120 [Aspergillus heteromorphus CBS 117.55]PWY91107.1 hypothetical protein BO70DRAFT_85120 [Aspergillus heteromorphus CBS 117.55]